MTAAQDHQSELVAKVVVTGVSGSGRASVLKLMARRYAQGAMRVGELAGGAVFRTEFYWPEALADGRRLRVCLFALSGKPVYNAVSELLLADCDGLVFVADVRQERLQEIREAFRGLVFNLRRGVRDLKSLPLVLQYHHREEAPAFDPELMDRWLEVTPGVVERMTARHPGNGSVVCAGVERVVTRIAREACPVQEASVA